MDEALLEHLQTVAPGFGRGRHLRFAFRCEWMIHLVETRTIQLVAQCMDWAKHRRRRAAAQGHVRLNLQSFLPHIAIADTAREPDNVRARELCAGVRAGEIIIFDKAYLDFDHWADLLKCEVCFKELTQILQLADFLGRNANAVRWQVRTALLVYLLLRIFAFLSLWGHSFARLFTLLRPALWPKLEGRSVLEGYGTAGGGGRFLGMPEQACLPGLG